MPQPYGWGAHGEQIFSADSFAVVIQGPVLQHDSSASPLILCSRVFWMLGEHLAKAEVANGERFWQVRQALRYLEHVAVTVTTSVF